MYFYIYVYVSLYVLVCVNVCIFLSCHFYYDWPFFLRQHTPKEVKLLKSEAVRKFRKLPLNVLLP